jgi:hypothetical protein
MPRDSIDTLVNVETTMSSNNNYLRNTSIDKSSLFIGFLIGASSTMLFVGLLDTLILSKNWFWDGSIWKSEKDAYNVYRLMSIIYMFFGSLLIFTGIPLAFCDRITRR